MKDVCCTQCCRVTPDIEMLLLATVKFESHGHSKGALNTIMLHGNGTYASLYLKWAQQVDQHLTSHQAWFTRST